MNGPEPWAEPVCHRGNRPDIGRHEALPRSKRNSIDREPAIRLQTWPSAQFARVNAGVQLNLVSEKPAAGQDFNYRSYVEWLNAQPLRPCRPGRKVGKLA